ncbi:sodium-dependent nutrient amino acid transporter 1 isoform X2 [Scaptodrosophila lebanonensis]|uniref:Sodium-dependent nutrient amino acid transporter 1 n=1 Tax=Drosophila lebanonensis TaxID=7225 RepID=A0A6J2T6D2_DROLE|nr:sodium-dependent nutrient amino acid transporter 1 isoform X2 [Scaptodrosophila lebanonensis]
MARALKSTGLVCGCHPGLLFFGHLLWHTHHLRLLQQFQSECLQGYCYHYDHGLVLLDLCWLHYLWHFGQFGTENWHYGHRQRGEGRCWSGLHLVSGGHCQVRICSTGIGSTVGMGSCIVRVIRDHWEHRAPPNWMLASGLAVLGFAVSIVYMTPGGQFILNLVDFYGVSFTALILAIGELLAVSWIYGLRRFCADIKFMMGIETGWYWRLCWAYITPGLMTAVLLYMLVDMTELTYKGVAYPRLAHGIGWTLATFGLLQIPGWALYAIIKQRKTHTFWQKVRDACRPDNNWGPASAQIALDDDNSKEGELLC